MRFLKILCFVLLCITGCSSVHIDHNVEKRVPVFISLNCTTIDDNAVQILKKNNPLGIILFGNNCVSENQTKSLINQIKKMGFFVAIDIEGKDVNRFREFWKLDKNATDFKYAKPSEVYAYYRKIGEKAASLGVDIIFAPVTDVCGDPSHFLYKRSFSDNLNKVSELALAAVKALQDCGIYPVIKHVPGHGRSSADTHLKLSHVNGSVEKLRKCDILASQSVIKKLQKENRPVPGAMVSHVIYDCVDKNNPATLSKKVIELVRQEIIQDGIIWSDDMIMMGVRKMLKNEAPEVAVKMFLQANGDIAICSKTDDLSKLKILSNCNCYKKLRKAIKQNRSMTLRNKQKRN